MNVTNSLVATIHKSDDLTFILLSILSSFVFIFILKYNWDRRYLYYYGSKINGPFGFPFIGNIHQFLGGRDAVFDTLMEIWEKYQPISKFWLGKVLYVSPSKPEDVEIILNHCLTKGLSYRYGAHLIGYGLVTAPVDRWKRHKKIVNTTFNQHLLNSFMDIFVKCANHLVQKLKQEHENGELFDIFPKICQCTLDTICETTMGVQIKAMDRENPYLLNVIRAQSLIQLRFFKLWLSPDFLWKMSSEGQETERICKSSWDFVRKIVKDKRRAATENDDEMYKKKIFLDRLIEITDKQAKFTDEELMEEYQTMVVAGSESSAIAQSYVMLILALHPQIQDLVYEELYEIFGNSNRDAVLADLNKMVYLERVIKETMRLFPVTPLLSRHLQNDVQLSSHLIPKGTVIFIPVIFIHRNPDLWPDPLKFDPDRFLPEEKAKRHRCSYLAFSYGVRNCIGKEYAMMSMKTILSTILRNYKVESTDYKSVADIKMCINILSKAANGYKISLRPR